MERWLGYMAPLSGRLAAKLKLPERLASGRWNLVHKMISLHGEETEMRHTKRFAADLVSATLLAAVGLIALTAAGGGDPYVALAGTAFVALVPFAMLNRLDRAIARKKRSIIMELPELLNTVTLLVNAGETVQGAIMRCADSYAARGAGGPLATEIVMLANRLRNNESLPHAMETFSKRCATAEVSVFTTTVLMNYRRGGDTFVLSLRSLNRDMWEKRKAMTRILGEEASSKLIMPMLLILIAVMAIVAAPAVMLME